MFPGLETRVHPVSVSLDPNQEAERGLPSVSCQHHTSVHSSAIGCGHSATIKILPSTVRGTCCNLRPESFDYVNVSPIESATNWEFSIAYLTLWRESQDEAAAEAQGA